MRTSKRLSASLFLVCAAVAAHADGVLQPVPVPDTSKLAPAAAKKIADDRAAIDKAKAGLIGPQLAQAYADIGALYARNGFDEAATVAFYDATQVSPNDARWYYLRGVTMRKLKRNEDARANFQAALERDKIYLPIRYRLADTLVDLGDFEGARRVLEQARSDFPERAITYAMLGDLAMKQKRPTDALVGYNQALQREPRATELYARIATAYAAQGNTKAADEARAKAGNGAVTMDDPIIAGLLTQQPSAGSTIADAEALALQGNIQAARDTLAVLLKKNPDDVNALTLSARIEAGLGDQAVARAAADQALKLKSDSAEVHMASGVVAEYAGDETKAYDEYRQAQKLDRKQSDSWLLLGNAEMRRARYAQAVEQYRGLAALQPDSTTAYAHLVAALFAQGKCADALSAVNEALARRKDDGDLLELFVRVASTCPAADAKTRDTALDYGQLLYKQHPDAGNAAALALALAAHGKFKDAQEYQAQAIFEVTRARKPEAATLLRSTMQQFVKQQVPDRPWPAEHPYFKAPAMSAAQPAPKAQQK